MTFDPWARHPHPPRAWQARALPLLLSCIRAKEKVVGHYCTGAGKSMLIEGLCGTIAHTLSPGWRIVVLVPSRALVEQTAAGLRSVLTCSVGMWYTRAHTDGTVIVCCIDSLEGLRDHLVALGVRVAHLLVDECHRANSEDVVRTIDEIAPATRVGITATPFRSAEGDRLRAWTRIADSYTIDLAVADGVLVPFQFVLPDASTPEDATEATIDMIRRHAPPGPGIVSATNINDAEECAAALCAAGIPAAPIHSRLKDGERKALIAKLKAGELRCLVHVALLVEGVDLPWLRWLAMRRPRQAVVAIVQEAGRVTRTCAPDQWGVKDRAVILLPHLTSVLDAIATPAALGEPAIDTARRLTEMELEETDEDRVEIDSALPPVSAVADVGAYAAAMLAAVGESGIALDDQREAGTWRVVAPTVRQVALVRELDSDKRKSGLRYLPESHRDAIRTALRRPETMTAGTVSDLIALLIALRRHGGIVYRSTGQFWRGLEGALPDVPTAACDAVGDRQRKPKRASRLGGGEDE